MKYLAAILTFLACFGLKATAQQNVRFSIADGLSDTRLKSNIESNVSQFLTEITKAGANGGELQLSGIRITDNAVHSLSLLWNNLHFVCEDSEITEHCNTTVNGYQVRNIAIKVIPVIEDYDGERERQLTISLSRQGEITGARMAMANHVYTNIIKQGDAVDMARREEILKFVEDFCGDEARQQGRSAKDASGDSLSYAKQTTISVATETNLQKQQVYQGNLQRSRSGAVEEESKLLWCYASPALEIRPL